MDARHAPIMPMLVVAVMPLASCAQQKVVAPSLHAPSAADAAPLIGRLRTRDQTLDLTRTSISAGGPAEDLARGVARVIADIDAQHARPASADEQPLRPTGEDLHGFGPRTRF